MNNRKELTRKAIDAKVEELGGVCKECGSKLKAVRGDKLLDGANIAVDIYCSMNKTHSAYGKIFVSIPVEPFDLNSMRRG